MIPSSTPFAALILTALIVMGSPGPSTISLTAVGASHGFARSLRYMAGLILGTVGVLVVVAVGAAAVLLAVPGVWPVLLWGSAAYMLYLAYRIATAPPLSEPDERHAAPSLISGFLLAIANPKAWLAITAVFAGATLSPAPPADALLKTLVLTLMIILIHLAWLIAGTTLSTLLRDPVRARMANVGMALVLVVATVASVLH